MRFKNLRSLFSADPPDQRVQIGPDQPSKVRFYTGAPEETAPGSVDSISGASFAPFSAFGGTVVESPDFGHGTSRLVMRSALSDGSEGPRAILNADVFAGGTGVFPKVIGSQGGPDVLAAQWLIQWGSDVQATDANGRVTVAFPAAFPTACVGVVPVNGDAGTNPNNRVGVRSYTAAQFVYQTDPVMAGGLYRCHWIAFGW